MFRVDGAYRRRKCDCDYVSTFALAAGGCHHFLDKLSLGGPHPGGESAEWECGSNAPHDVNEF
jgi:hypothetical protein